MVVVVVMGVAVFVLMVVLMVMGVFMVMFVTGSMFMVVMMAMNHGQTLFFTRSARPEALNGDLPGRLAATFAHGNTPSGRFRAFLFHGSLYTSPGGRAIPASEQKFRRRGAEGAEKVK